VTLGVKKVVAWLVIAFVVFYVIKQPDNSARLVRDAGHALGDAASSLATFVGSIF
jgi:large-conductance mechanosensitive channel